MDKFSDLSLSCHALLTAQLSFEMADRSLAGKHNSESLKLALNDLETSHRMLVSSLQRSLTGLPKEETDSKFLYQWCSRLGQKTVELCRKDTDASAEGPPDGQKSATSGRSRWRDPSSKDTLRSLEDMLEKSALCRNELYEKIATYLNKGKTPYLKELQSQMSLELKQRNAEVIKTVLENRRFILDSKASQIELLAKGLHNSSNMTGRSDVRAPNLKVEVSGGVAERSPIDDDDEEHRPLDKSKQYSPVLNAASTGDRASLRIILASDPAAPYVVDNSTGMTALHVACINGHDDCAQILLEVFANVNLRDLKGKTALHYAVEYKRAALVRLLLANNSKKDIRDDNRKTPADCAEQNSEIEFMFKYGHDLTALNPNQLDANNFFALQGNSEAVRSLLSQGAEVDSICKDNKTPLMRAVEAKRLDAMLVLISNGANIEHCSHEGRTPLILAAETQYLDGIKLLISSGANIEHRDDRGMTALALTCCRKNPIALEFLLKSGANPHTLNKLSNSTLHDAYRYSDHETVRTLLASGVDSYLKGADGLSVLSRACSDGRPDMVTLLLESGVNPNMMPSTDQFELPLYVAAKNNQLECLQTCLDHGADPNTKDHARFRYVALHVAAIHGHTRIVQELLSYKETDYTLTNTDGMTALHEAAKHGHPEIAEALLNRGLSAGVLQNSGDSPARLAAVEDHRSVLQVLIRHGADLDLANEHGWTPIMGAAARGLVGMVELLLAGGASADAKDTRGCSALSKACEHGQLDVVRLLIKKAEVDLNQRDNAYWTPLMHAAHRGRREIAGVLISKGARLDCQNDGGKDAYQVAHEVGHSNVVALIEEARKAQKKETSGAESDKILEEKGV